MALREHTMHFTMPALLAPCLCALAALRKSPLAPLQWVRSPPPSLVAVPSTELRIRTAELKEQLIQSCAAFKAAQKAEWDAQDAKGVGPQQATGERLKSPLKAEGFGNVEVSAESERLAAAKAETIRLIEALATRNPTSAPFDGWQTTKGCALEGTWRLLFTTGADATFRPSNTSGTPKTFQRIDTRKGLFVNCVDFAKPQGKLEGFRVVVAGKPLSQTEVSLSFKRVKLLRRSRVRLLRTLVIPLPPGWLLRGIARWASRGKAQLSKRGAGFEMLYLDDELRMHKTFDGQYFVQQRDATETFYKSTNFVVRKEEKEDLSGRQAAARAATAAAYGKKKLGALGAPEGFVWGPTV